MRTDTDSWSSPRGRGLLSLTVLLIAINVVVFLGEIVNLRTLHWPLNQWLALSIRGLRAGYYWQLITFQFLHGGWLHLFLNCWALFVFGRELEEALGRMTFLKLYLISGVVGGVIQVLGALMVPGLFGSALVGASAGVFGLVSAYAALYPSREFTLLLFFVIPVTLKARTLLFWAVVIAIVGALFPTSNVAHAAHLGGMLGGLLYLNWIRPPRR